MFPALFCIGLLFVDLYIVSEAKYYSPVPVVQDESCGLVCVDLPPDDTEPVCMMFSRYKKGYQFFVNECQARRAVCREKLLLHLVHPSRCIKTNQFFMPIS